MSEELLNKALDAVLAAQAKAGKKRTRAEVEQDVVKFLNALNEALEEAKKQADRTND
jgi:hypothetical protein